jgi:hypothetical protein
LKKTTKKRLTLGAERPRPHRSQNDQKFFAAFFQKRRPCFRLPLLSAGYRGGYQKPFDHFGFGLSG